MRSLLLFTFVAISFSINLYPQTEQQIVNKLQQQGITSREEVLNELHKRGMTEDDARRLAKQYGMNYDQFISTYILGGKSLMPELTSLPPDTMVVKQNVVTPVQTMNNNIQKQVSEKVDSTLKLVRAVSPYFGYNIFKNIPQAFLPNQVGPVDPGYLTGPGDVLQLYVWGDAQFQYQLIVDQQGNIFIPTVGQFFVSGVAYKDLQNVLTNYLSKYYSGLAAKPPTIFLSITLAQLRPIRIFVMGEVSQPGGYTISSYATVFNALYSVGGPLTSGSLRDIRVIRNNKVIASVDLYDYLLKGQLIGDVRLQDNDMIFVPPRGKTVTIKGEVLRPAIYELKDEENLSKLISYAGGLKTTAYLGRIQVNRIIPFAERKNFELERKVIDINIDSLLYKIPGDFQLFDRDEITIFPILSELRNYVNINGAVYRPGSYELEKVPRISDLIKAAYGILPEAYIEKADIIRTRPDLTFEFLTFNLGKALYNDPANNILLKSKDRVKIYSIHEIKDLQNVSISGYVKEPVTMTYADSLTLFDMVFKAGGLEDPFFRAKAYLQRGDLIRYNKDSVTTRIIPFNLKKLLTDKAYNMKLQPGDRIHIYKADVDSVIEKKVTIKGEVRNPGEYLLDVNMTPMDLIIRAGGFMETSLKSEVYINRLDINGYSGQQLSQTFNIKLPNGFEKVNGNKKLNYRDSTGSLFYLDNHDIVVVRKNSAYEPQRTVKLLGEVRLPGEYVLKYKNETLTELINEAGGPTSEAFFHGAVFTRNSQRVALNLEEIYTEKNADEDMTLQNSDQIFIPKRPNSVLVQGEVGQAGLYKFIKGKEVKDYIDAAGGTTDSANYVIYRQASGLTVRVGFGWFSDNPEVTDGSAITVTKVPYEPPKVNQGQSIGSTIKDIFAIAVSAITAIVLAKGL